MFDSGIVHDELKTSDAMCQINNARKCLSTSSLVQTFPLSLHMCSAVCNCFQYTVYDNQKSEIHTKLHCRGLALEVFILKEFCGDVEGRRLMNQA